MNVGAAVQQFVDAHRCLVRCGINDFVGSYGERIAEIAIGGKLMPPTFKAFDLKHPEYGRVQIKTRAMLDRLEGALSNETRAVIGKNRGFDWLFHLVLNRDLMVVAAILAPIDELSCKLESSSGKIAIEKTRILAGAVDVTLDARRAQVILNAESCAA